MARFEIDGKLSWARKDEHQRRGFKVSIGKTTQMNPFRIVVEIVVELVVVQLDHLNLRGLGQSRVNK